MLYCTGLGWAEFLEDGWREDERWMEDGRLEGCMDGRWKDGRKIKQTSSYVKQALYGVPYYVYNLIHPLTDNLPRYLT